MLTIDPSLCTQCGLCGVICPRHVLETVTEDGKKITRVHPGREAVCLGCGQCAAVCPAAAVTVAGLDPKGFQPVQPSGVKPDDLLRFFQQRRSVRRYLDKPVSRELLSRILEAAAVSPTGTSHPTNGVLVVDDKKQLSGMMEQIYAMYRFLDQAVRNPFMRLIIRLKSGRKVLHTLEQFALPGVRLYMRWHAEGRGDEISRDCPVLMLFHAPADEPEAEANCVLAAMHAALMAESLGLGACLNGLIPPVCNRSPRLRRDLGLEKTREIHACLTLGYPRYKYRRTIPRSLQSVRFLE